MAGLRVLWPVIFAAVLSLMSFDVRFSKQSGLYVPSSLLFLWNSALRKTNPSFVVSVAIGIYITVKLRRLLFVPIQLGNVFSKPAGKYPCDFYNDVEFPHRVTNFNDFPPVYPNGWFELLLSSDLQPGQVKHIDRVGENFAIFRGEDGVVSILDAYCPHLGANLGVGGQVIGNDLQCPFHGWKFRGVDGKCTGIPYSKIVPEHARVKSWPCLERNGSIMVWYHAEGVAPSYLPEEITQITDGSMTYQGIVENRISCHIQDITENNADIAHLPVVHNTACLWTGADQQRKTTWRDLVLRHDWEGTWEVMEDDRRVAIGTYHIRTYLFGYRFPLLDLHAKAKQTGPGLVYMHFQTSFGSMVLAGAMTPVHQVMSRKERLYSDTFLVSLIARFFIHEISMQVERDAVIWNHKKYIPKPLLVTEDHLIARYRRWYSQFYSKNSPTLRLGFRDHTNDW